MKTALLYFEKYYRKNTEQLVSGMADAVRRTGQNLTVFNGYTLHETDRFAFFDYIALFIADKPFFSSKPDDAIFQRLESHGLCAGKKCAVFTPLKGLFSVKFSRAVMNRLEKNGCRIDYFDCIKSIADAKRAAAYIG